MVFYGQRSTARNYPDQEWRMPVPTQEDQLHLCCWWVLAIVSHGGRFGSLHTSAFLWSGHRSLRRKVPGCRSHSLSTSCTRLLLPGTYHRTSCIPLGHLQSGRPVPAFRGTCVSRNIYSISRSDFSPAVQNREHLPCPRSDTSPGSLPRSPYRSPPDGSVLHGNIPHKGASVSPVSLESFLSLC